MGHFDGSREYNVKTTKCRPNVHHPSRGVVARYPHGHRSKLLLMAAPHLAQRGILIDVVYPLKLGIFRVPDWLRMRHVGGLFWVNSEGQSEGQSEGHSQGTKLSKTGSKLSKTGTKTALNPVKRPCNTLYCI